MGMEHARGRARFAVWNLWSGKGSAGLFPGILEHLRPSWARQMSLVQPPTVVSSNCGGTYATWLTWASSLFFMAPGSQNQPKFRPNSVQIPDHIQMDQLGILAVAVHGVKVVGLCFLGGRAEVRCRTLRFDEK